MRYSQGETMSVSYNACVVAGVMFNECSRKTQSELDALIEAEVIYDFPPKFDWCRYGAVGIYVMATADYATKEIDPDTFSELCTAAKKKFTELTNLEAKIYLTPQGS
jgi:hypothetical protein